jgi:hypothetical protein
MRITDFYEKVKEDPEIEGVDMLEWGVVVKNSKGWYVSIRIESIVENNWDSIRNMIFGTQPLYHVSRVVGYYSRIENWNDSKIGELKDRRQGDYDV